MVRFVMRGRVFLMIAILLLLVASVHAADSDLDGIKNEFDACPNTPYDTSLPIIKTNTEYFGCSCKQIDDLIGENSVCVNVFCFEDRPLVIEERSLSDGEVNCGDDYCVGKVLYDFSAPAIVDCKRGKIPENYCEPVLVNNSELCISGEVGQKPVENIPVIQKIPEKEKQTYIDFFYDVVLENEEIRNLLGRPNRNDFQKSIEDLQKKVILSKTISQKQVADTQITIPLVTINVSPAQNQELKNVIIFEHIKNTGFEKKYFVSFDVEPLLITDDGVVIWNFDKIENEFILRYQVNKPMLLDSDTAMVAKVNAKFFLDDWWPILLIPLIFYLAYRYILYSKK